MIVLSLSDPGRVSNLVAVLQDKDDSVLRGGAHVLDQVVLNARNGGGRSFFAVVNGNTASRGSVVLALADHGGAEGLLELLELFGLDKFLGHGGRFGKTSVVCGIQRKKKNLLAKQRTLSTYDVF